MARYIGKEMSRVDGFAKVTGQAKYTAEFKVPNLAYGFIVTGTIAKGNITAIDTAAASAAPGVIRVLTHENYPAAPSGDGGRGGGFRALGSKQIEFNMQP
ncbi:xanthine dehydrogenase family protein molybdopterin-binding subunit, partial [bacterium]